MLLWIQANFEWDLERPQGIFKQTFSHRRPFSTIVVDGDGVVCGSFVQPFPHTNFTLMAAWNRRVLMMSKLPNNTAQQSVAFAIGRSVESSQSDLTEITEKYHEYNTHEETGPMTTTMAGWKKERRVKEKWKKSLWTANERQSSNKTAHSTKRETARKERKHNRNSKSERQETAIHEPLHNWFVDKKN